MKGIKTRSQEMALYAFECIQEIKNLNNGKLEKEYRSRARSLPSMITHNGLITALTFLYAKSSGKKEEKPAEKYLLQHMIGWLNKTKNKSPNENDVRNFLKKLMEMEFRQLLITSKEALSISQWIKRISEGELKEDEET